MAVAASARLFVARSVSIVGVRNWMVAGFASILAVAVIPNIDGATTPIQAGSVSICGSPEAATPFPASEPRPAADGGDPFDLDVIDSMIEHHVGAIAMANVALQRAQDSAVHRMALRIAESQAGELQLLRYWRSAWYPSANRASPASSHQDTNSIPQSSEESALAALCAADQGFDRLFLESMIAHHQTTIALAERTRAAAEHPELVEVATSLIQIRGEEIATMSRWLTENEPASPTT